MLISSHMLVNVKMTTKTRIDGFGCDGCYNLRGAHDGKLFNYGNAIKFARVYEGSKVIEFTHPIITNPNKRLKDCVS